MLTSAVNTLWSMKATFCWYLGTLTSSLRTLLLDTSSQLLLYDPCEARCLSETTFNKSSSRRFSAWSRLRASSASLISSCVSFLVSGFFMLLLFCPACAPEWICVLLAEAFFAFWETRAFTMSNICIMLVLTFRVSSFLMCVLFELVCPCIFTAL